MREKSTSVSKRLFTLIVQDCTEIVKIYSAQIEGNKDCEVLICVDFYHYVSIVFFLQPFKYLVLNSSIGMLSPALH